MDIPVVSWLDDIIGSAFRSVFDSLNQSTDEYVKSRDLFLTGRQRYTRHIQDRYGSIQILGMTRPIELADTYVNVRVNEQIPTKRYLDIEMLQSGNRKYLQRLAKERKRQSMNPLTTLENHQRVALLGKPGSGKTTLLKYLALLNAGCLNRTPANSERLRLPVVIVLRDITAKTRSLFEIISSTFSHVGFPHADLFLTRVFETGRVLVLLDGLDEVPEQQQRQTHRLIFDLIAKFPRAQYVVSCRTAAYQNNYEGFVEVEVEDFNESSKYLFTERWFRGDPPKARSLIGKLKQQPQLADLASSPLLLSLICILYGRELDLPKNRVELYEKCIRTMLQEWDSSRSFRRETKYEQLSDYKKTKLFNYLAASFFQNNEKVFTSRSLVGRIARYISRLGMNSDDATGILNEIASHHGILVPVSSNSFSFSHLTFQEFLTACHTVDTRREYGLLKFRNDPRWLEVFCITAGLLEDATRFVRALLDSSAEDRFMQLCLAAYCVTGEATVDRSVKKEVFEQLVEEMLSNSDRIRRLYITNPSNSERRHAVFFEVEGKYLHDIDEIAKAVRFLGTVNCLFAFFNARFLSELSGFFGSTVHRKFARLCEYLQRCRAEGCKAVIYSNLLRRRGLELPMEVTNFESRIVGYLGIQGAVQKEIKKRIEESRQRRRREASTAPTDSLPESWQF